jgi:hypothetical protein
LEILPSALPENANFGQHTPSPQIQFRPTPDSNVQVPDFMEFADEKPSISSGFLPTIHPVK